MTMRAIGRSTEEIQAALQAYRDEIAEIDAMIPNGTFLVRGAGTRVREAANNLKAEVKSDYERTVKHPQSMSEVERNFFAPCIHRVFVALQMFRTNTSPGPDWKRALLNADSELNHWMNQLRSVSDG